MIWPLRSILAGSAGTATMTAAYEAERRERGASRPGPLDYDDGLVPGQIVAGIMHLPHVTDTEERDLGLALRWSYGSAFGLLHGKLRRVVGEPWANAAFGGTLITATMTLSPVSAARRLPGAGRSTRWRRAWARMPPTSPPLPRSTTRCAEPASPSAACSAICAAAARAACRRRR